MKLRVLPWLYVAGNLTFDLITAQDAVLLVCSCLLQVPFGLFLTFDVPHYHQFEPSACDLKRIVQLRFRLSRFLVRWTTFPPSLCRARSDLIEKGSQQ